MSDLINRQDAIDAMHVLTDSICEGMAIDVLSELPSAERRGQWIEEHEPFTWMGYTRWGCPCCGFKCGYELEIKCRTNFCPNCGADMK